MRVMLYDGTDLSDVQGQLAHADEVFYHGGFVIARMADRENNGTLHSYHVNTQTGEWTRLGMLAAPQVTLQ